jgi:hypothetical protein
MELDEIFTNHISDKGLIPKTYEKLPKFNSSKQPDFKMGTVLEQAFFQRKKKGMANEYIKICLTSLIIREM